MTQAGVLGLGVWVSGLGFWGSGVVGLDPEVLGLEVGPFRASPYVSSYTRLNYLVVGWLFMAPVLQHTTQLGVTNTASKPPRKTPSKNKNAPAQNPEQKQKHAYFTAHTH